MAGIRVSPITTKEASCRCPCQVAGVVRMVLSVGEMSPIMPMPAMDNNQVVIPAERTRGRLKRSPDAKIIIRSPLRKKVSVMIHPIGPRASPLGQSRGALNLQPMESIKSRSRIVSAIMTLPKSSGPIIPASAALLIRDPALIVKEIR